MRRRRSLGVVVLTLSVLAATPVAAVKEDACKGQRADFPQSWKATAGHGKVLSCSAHYLKLTLLEDSKKRLVVVTGEGEVYRSYASLADARSGRAVTLLTAASCTIRGSTSAAGLLVLSTTPKDGNAGVIQVPKTTSVELINECTSPK